MCINDYNFMPITPESSEYSGGHIGYTYVIDQLSDGSYTRYHFTNFDDEGGMNTDDTVMVNYQGTRNRDYVPVSTRKQDRGNQIAGYIGYGYDEMAGATGRDNGIDNSFDVVVL